MAMAQERYKQVHAELHFYETRKSLFSHVTLFSQLIAF